MADGLMGEEPPVKAKFQSIEDIPGVGPATAAKLKDIGFSTLEALATATIRELTPVGIGDKQAARIIGLARDSISTQFITTEELLKERAKIQRLTTSSKALDDLIGGGLETQTITEFFGEYGTGKSQLCHQLCVNVQLPVEKGGLGGGALYVDTEHTYSPERICQMAQHLGLDPSEVVKNIIYAEAFNSDHQTLLLERCDSVVKQNNLRLVVIDSLTAHFRSEYLGREMLAERQQKLNKHMHRLIRLSRAFNLAAVVTNQVMARPDVFFGDSITAVGGHIVAHTSHTRLFIRKAASGPVRIVKLVSSPYLPEGERVFKVTENGVEDVAEEDEVRRR